MTSPRFSWASIVLTMAGALSASCTEVDGPNIKCLVSADCPVDNVCVDGICRPTLFGTDDGGGGNPNGNGDIDGADPAEGEGDTGPGDEGEGDSGTEGEGDGGTEGEGEPAPSSGLLWAPAAVVFAAVDVNVAAIATVQLVNTAAVERIVTLSLADGRFSVGATTVTVAAGGQSSVMIGFQSSQAGAAASTIEARVAGAAPVIATLQATVRSAAQQLIVTSGADVSSLDAAAGCGCGVSEPAADVQLRYSATNGTCTRPADQSCGLNDTCAAVSLGGGGDARWRSGRDAQPRSNDGTWIIDEEVVHTPAGDGTFLISATINDNCLVAPGSLSTAANNACCLLDCDGNQACYAYGNFPSCGNDCPAHATLATSDDCLVRGRVPVRTVLSFAGTTRTLCSQLDDGATGIVATMRVTGGVFTVESLGAGVTEVAAAAACPL
jgi:hypothetical protein